MPFDKYLHALCEWHRRAELMRYGWFEFMKEKEGNGRKRRDRDGTTEPPREPPWDKGVPRVGVPREFLEDLFLHHFGGSACVDAHPAGSVKRFKFIYEVAKARQGRINRSRYIGAK